MTLTADVIEGFSRSLLQKSFDGAVESPACHREWWEMFCYPHPQVAIAAPRRHAKTTAITQTCTLASVCFREREYVLIVSDTITQANQFLGDIKRELLDNDALRSLFKIKELTKDSEDDMICLCEDGHEFRITAKGAEQKIRGLKWKNKRPDMIVCDDLENDEIVLNKERRAKFKRWFYASLLPCRSYRGIVRYVGTILHNDSLLESVMPRKGDKYTVEQPLKSYSSKQPSKLAWYSVKYRAHDPDFKNILWKELYSAEHFKTLRQQHIDDGMADVYSQEYLNYPLDESLSYFRRSDFTDYSDQDRVKFDGKEWLKGHNIYIGSDLAVSTADYSDYSVFVVGAVAEDGMLYIHNVIREKMDAQEIVETILSLQRVYDPMCLSMEKGQIEKSIGPFLRERMMSENCFVNILPLSPTTDKKSRARSIQARMRMGGVKFDKQAEWFHTLEEEAVMFGRGKHDDQVDALSYLGLILDKMVEGPTQREIEDIEYADELRESGSDYAGQSSITGY
jgi:predicted phage terminase large subunit-like protein